MNHLITAHSIICVHVLGCNKIGSSAECHLMQQVLAPMVLEKLELNFASFLFLSVLNN